MADPNNQFNNIITPGFDLPIEDRNTIDLLKSGEAQLREVMKTSYEPNKLKTQTEFNAICLVQLPSFLVGDQTLIRVKARIPELHSLLPIPQNNEDYNAIALYPTFQASAGDFGFLGTMVTDGAVIPGAKLVVSFDQMGNFAEGSLQKIFSWKEVSPGSFTNSGAINTNVSRSDLTSDGSSVKNKYAKGYNAANGPLVLPSKVIQNHPTIIDFREKHSGAYKSGKFPKTRRHWKNITGITLHQTAANIGEKESRFAKIAIAFAVTQQGKSIYLRDMDWKIPHGHGFNSHDVGIEIDGMYAGKPGKDNSLGKIGWGKKKGKKEDEFPAAQIKAVKNTIRFIIDEVKANGGEIKYVHSHRQAFGGKSGDPGWQIWSKIALWAQNELGLSDGGAGFYIPRHEGFKLNKEGTKLSRIDGLPIPKQWDPKSKYAFYEWEKPSLTATAKKDSNVRAEVDALRKEMAQKYTKGIHS